MENAAVIFVAILILSPLGLFIYGIDYKIKPYLKKTRHDLLYITAVEALILVYSICLGYLLKLCGIDCIINLAVFGLFMSMTLLIIFTAAVTLLWWTVFFLKQLIKP